jgi:hypothetical protein
VRGTDNQLWFTYGTGGGWQNFGSPNGKGFYGSPSSVVWSNGTRINVFVLGTDLKLWNFYWDGFSWQWNSFNSKVFSGPPVAISRSSSTMDVFMAGVDLQLYWFLWDGSTWHAPQKISAPVPTGIRISPYYYWNVVAPVGVASSGPNNLEVFAKGDVGPSAVSVVHASFNGTSWSAWEARPEISVGNSGSIAAVSWGPNRVDAFVSDTGVENMYHTSRTTAGWYDEHHTPLVDRTTGVVGDPVAISTGTNILDVFYRNGFGSLIQLHYQNGWLGWLLADNVVH